MNRSFPHPNNIAKNSWKSDLKRTHREVHASPDSLSDYSPLRSTMRLHQDGQIFGQSFMPDRGSPFRFVPINSINPDAEKGNPSKAFQFPFGK